jgi:hypothetical protein
MPEISSARFRLSRVPLVAVLAVAAALVMASASRGASSGVVVSQVYGGGGNAGALFANDFVELLNRGSSAVDLSGWSVQYATAAGTSWQATSLSGSLAPGRYYLVQLASSAAVGAALPAPDATGTTNLAASGGKIALVRDVAALTCGASAGSCSATALVEDLVGYGSATDFEGPGPAPALSSTTAAVRAGAGCTDSDVNSADFTAVAPAPRNTSSPAAACTVTPPSGGASQGASVDVEVEPVLAIALERPSLSFGQAAAGTTPPAISERVTVTSTHATGYALTVHRSAFSPSDLPLGISASGAPAGGQLGAGLGGASPIPVPVVPTSDLLVGTTAAAAARSGDVWPISIGFSAPLPQVSSGRYTATVTFTVIGR